MLTTIIFDTVFYLDWRSILVGLLVFVPLEHIRPLRKTAVMVRSGILTDVAHFLLSGIFVRLGLGLVILGATALGAAVVPAGMQAGIVALPLPLQVLLASLIADLGVYLAHRAMHEIPLLWRFHAVHHSSEQLDWLAAFRVHPVDQMIIKGVSIVPLYVLGFSMNAILIAAIIYVWHALLVHSNVDLRLGRLRMMIAGPEFHHWHHANEPEARDKNFAAQFPLWDIIFQTFYLPERMPRRYGVDDPIPRSWLGQIIYPFQRKPPKLATRQTGKV